MSAAKDLLQRLGTRGITEITLVSGQTAYGNAGETPTAIDATIHSTEEVLQILFEAGGSRHVDTLGVKPSNWTARIEGVGRIEVTATMHGEFIQAKFTRSFPKDQPAPISSSGSPALQGAAGMPLRPTPIAFVAPQPHARPTPRTTPVAFVAPQPNARPAAVKPAIPAAKPTIPDRPTPLTAPKPTAAALGSSEVAFDFTLDAEHGRKAPLSPQPPGTAPVVPPPPPARLPLDTPFSEFTPYADPRSPYAVSSGTAAFFKELLLSARARRASDLHLVAGRPPAYRIAGELTTRGEPIEAQRLAELVLPRVPPRLLASLEKDGSADFALEEPGAGRFRVNVGRQRTGLKAAFRLIPNEIPTLDSLGLPDAIGLATHHHQGLIVITGPTGHGKTTTLAAIVDILNSETARHVITVEDPVELVHPRKKAMMSQREVGTHTRSFQAALKASLREDPDVIVVGELRDTETVRIALGASETGHLVLGTMNTPSAAKTIDRLIDLFPPGDQQQVRVTLAGGLRLIVGQRLLPSSDRSQLVAAAEVLPGSLALWNLIRDSRTYQIPSLQQRGKAHGILRLDDSLAALVRSNRTTIDAALAVAEAPAELEARLTGRRTSSVPPRPDAGEGEAAPDRGSSPQIPPPRQGLLERAGALLGKRGS